MKRQGRIYGKWSRFFYPATGAFLLLFMCLLFGGRKQEEASYFSLSKEVVKQMQEKTVQTYFPVFSFVEEEGKAKEKGGFWESLLESRVPLYAWMKMYYVQPLQTESLDTWEEIALEEGREAHEKEGDELEINNDLIEAIKKENEDARFEQAENNSIQMGEFAEAQKSIAIDLGPLQEFEQLLGQFYAVDSTTSIGREQLNVDKLLQKDMVLKTDASKPQILIYHTHSQEAFADSEPGKESDTIMGAGERLAEILRTRYGFNVIHHTGKYDVESRDYAYSNAEPDLERVLSENPSIEVIIDLHRDEMTEGRKLVTDVQGRPTARFMFFNGLSRTNKTGDIAYLKNPYIDENLAFSFQMQLACNEYYPGITRKIYLKGYRYNMHFRGKSLLIELGAQTNTVEEIRNACDPLAHVLALVLKGEA